MNQIATYDIYCTVLFYSVHHFCAGTALALCAIALLSGACAIIPMALCTSLCQTYCTPLPSHNYHHPVKNGWRCCVLKKRYIGFAWTSPAHRHSDYSPHLGGPHPVCLVGVGTPLYTSTLRHGIYYLPRSNFTVAVSTKSHKKTLTRPGNPADKTQDILHQFLDIRS